MNSALPPVYAWSAVPSSGATPPRPSPSFGDERGDLGGFEAAELTASRRAAPGRVRARACAAHVRGAPFRCDTSRRPAAVRRRCGGRACRVPRASPRRPNADPRGSGARVAHATALWPHRRAQPIRARDCRSGSDERRRGRLRRRTRSGRRPPRAAVTVAGRLRAAIGSGAPNEALRRSADTEPIRETMSRQRRRDRPATRRSARALRPGASCRRPPHRRSVSSVPLPRAARVQCCSSVVRSCSRPMNGSSGAARSSTLVLSTPRRVTSPGARLPANRVAHGERLRHRVDLQFLQLLAETRELRERSGRVADS